MSMTSNKPYLIRAIYDWIVDNGLTPYLLVSTTYPGVEVPSAYVEMDRIVLNISPKACRGLHLDNDVIVFTTRFSGEATQLSLSPAAVLAIYAKENGRGMEFELEEGGGPPTTPETKVRGKPALSLVK